MLIYLQMLESDADRLRFEQLYHRYRGLMFYVARQILPCDEDAEDAVHEAFVAIIRHFEGVSEITDPKTRAFVVLIAERKAIDLLCRWRKTASASRSRRRATVDSPTRWRS